jgi:predicted metal-dependent enzyme (double-stranded beta helix superfamily)
MTTDATLHKFGTDCRSILKSEPEATAIEKVRQLLEERLLTDQEIISAYLTDEAAPARNVLYEDPELGFCVVAHNYQGENNSRPHDHGPTWAIYGQVKGVTVMTEYRLVEKPKDGKPGVVEPAKSYELKPGMAAAYATGVLHSPSRADTTRLIRIEGNNLTAVKRDSYVCA